MKSRIWIFKEIDEVTVQFESDEEEEEFSSNVGEDEIVSDDEEETSRIRKLSLEFQFLILCMWKCLMRTRNPTRGFPSIFKKQEDLVQSFFKSRTYFCSWTSLIVTDQCSTHMELFPNSSIYTEFKLGGLLLVIRENEPQTTFIRWFSDMLNPRDEKPYG